MLNMVVVALRELLEQIANHDIDAIESVMDVATTLTAFIKTLQKN